MSLWQQDQQSTKSLPSSLYSRRIGLATESFDQNCQPSSLNMPSRGTHFTPPAHTSGILGF